MKKVVFVLGLIIGYVFGTRAGRERYEQIKRAAATLWESNLVKRGRASVEQYTDGIRSSVQDSVVDAARNLVQAVLQFTKSAPDETAAPAPKKKAPAKSAAPKKRAPAKSTPAKKRSSSSTPAKTSAESQTQTQTEAQE